MFLKPDDYMILMDLNDTPHTFIPGSHAVTLEDLKKVKDIGINTVMTLVFWNTIEPSMGKVDWKLTDTLLEKYRTADLRALIVAPVFVPRDAPDDYYLKYENGTLEKDSFSIWNQEAMGLQREFLEKMVARYTAPDVQIVLGDFRGGEYLLPLEAAFYDTSALASYGSRPDSRMADPCTVEWLKKSVIDHFLFMQEPLVKQHNEIWDALHMAIAYWSRTTGNQFQADIHAAYHNKWPDVTVVLLQYTFMEHILKEGYLGHIDNLKRMGARVIMEANYPSGLKDSTPMAISKGFSGQLCGPLHPEAPEKAYDRIKPEQLEAMANSIRLWRNDSNKA